MRLKDKTILITAAGQGMGRAAAIACAAEGARVIATDRDPALLEGLTVETHALDVTDPAALIEMAAARQAFVDQSQSLNLFIESLNIGKLSSMYLYAWKAGLKTTYYLRSRPATRIQQATVAGVRAGASWGAATGAPAASQPTAPGAPGAVGGLTASEPVRTFTDEEALACSLENPEACEACE